MISVKSDAKNADGKKRRETAIIVILVISWLLAGASSFALYPYTLVNVWIPTVICCGLAALTGVRFRRRWRAITDSDGMIPNFICHFIYSAVLFLGLFFSLNFFVSVSDTEYEEQVTVERKYSKKKHRSRRVGRHRYTQGEAYYEYYAQVRLPDGRLKEITVPLAVYNRTRTGSDMSLSMRRGLFGVPVIKHMSSCKTRP